jgi:hypothetical protein
MCEQHREQVLLEICKQGGPPLMSLKAGLGGKRPADVLPLTT